jgi:Popeye protein conserved region
MDLQFLLQHAVHLGAILYLVCFLFRDQIWLRSFAIAGDIAYVTYYFNISDQPLWGAILWNIPNALINIVMIYSIVRDGRTGNFTENELKLYGRLGDLPIAEFRKIVRLGQWKVAHADTLLTSEGEALENLHYIMDGGLEIDKGGRKIQVNSGLFIGEIAFLKKRPASATVRVKQGSTFITWSHAALRLAQEKNASVKLVISAMLNDDMAEKVARS